MEYTPIAKALCNLDTDAELKVKRKFDIANLIAKHNLHGIHKDEASVWAGREAWGGLGPGYKNDQACATFVGCTAIEPFIYVRVWQVLVWSKSGMFWHYVGATLRSYQEHCVASCVVFYDISNVWTPLCQWLGTPRGSIYSTIRQHHMYVTALEHVQVWYVMP